MAGCMIPAVPEVVCPEMRCFAMSMAQNHQYSSHWRDTKHEPEWTARDLLVEEDGREPEEEHCLGYFRIGSNDGEKQLKREIDALVRKYDGSDECWDDVTGAQLLTILVNIARALEMKFFDKIVVCLLSIFTATRRRNGKQRSLVGG